jgi:formylglycine-generating enzyme required for sulfatase activity
MSLLIPQHNFTQQLPNSATAFTMIHVTGGTFSMGSAADDRDRDSYEEQHTVELDTFHIGQYPVTQALYKAVMDNQNPSEFIGDDRPVERVSWFDAAVFCNKLNEILGLQPCYYVDAAFQYLYGKTANGYELPNEGAVFIRLNSKGYHLPSEAQWEYAARGGKVGVAQNFKYAGSNKLKEVGWFDTNSHQETKPVGIKSPNILGLYDMSGNIWELCQDWWNEDYYKDCANKGTVKNPLGPDKGGNRVVRGGGWIYSSEYCRVSLRGRNTPALSDDHLGFRLSLH